MTLPNPHEHSISPYHTYCVAVGSGFLDHTPVIDFYSKVIKSLMSGNQFYCASEMCMKNINFGVLAVLADCPEKASILNTSLLGTYGKITSWASDINPNVLTDYQKCLKKV